MDGSTATAAATASAAATSTSAPDIIGQMFSKGSATGAPTIPALLTIAAAATLAGLYIFYIYKRTYGGAMYNRSFNISLVLLTLVAALAIAVITSYPVLSLGMIGALSVVRFRTAIKDVMDVVFAFYAMSAGIAIGAGGSLVLIGLAGTAVVGVAFYAASLFNGRDGLPYLLIVRHSPGCANEVRYALRRLPGHARMKSKTVTQNGVEVIMELRLPAYDAAVETGFMRIHGVTDAKLVSLEGELGSQA